MKPYVYVPYPQVLYQGTKEAHDTLTVQSETEHRDAAQAGWITAGELHGYEGAGPAFPDLVAPPVAPDEPVEAPKGKKK